MEKKEITEILNMSLSRFLSTYGTRDGRHFSSGRISGIIDEIHKASFFSDVPYNSPVRNYIIHSKCDWQRVRTMGKLTLDMIIDVLESCGLYIGMTKEDVARLEGNTYSTHVFQDEATEAPTLSFQEYINALKQFADNAGGCTITNELHTADGYTISVRIKKTDKK